jgi:hypothetical protein
MKNQTTSRKEVSQIDWARLAAYIDGEGCIRIDLQNPPEDSGFTPRHLLEVRVYNCDPRLLLWCRDTFSGGNLKPVRKVPRPGHKQELVWYVGADRATKILEGCLPYFILKREQAEIALAFRQLTGKRGTRTSPELYASREALRIQMSVLNRRGVPITPEN